MRVKRTCLRPRSREELSLAGDSARNVPTTGLTVCKSDDPAELDAWHVVTYNRRLIRSECCGMSGSGAMTAKAFERAHHPQLHRGRDPAGRGLVSVTMIFCHD